MSEYFAKVIWERQQQAFLDNEYSRGHRWVFDGGVEVPASSSPHIVPLPFSVETNVDPEEAFIASLSSCHMLFFLALAVKKKWLIDQYEDDAIGYLDKDEFGKMAMTKVILRPKIVFSGASPSLEEIEHLHHKAHDLCFIANSVKTDVMIETSL